MTFKFSTILLLIYTSSTFGQVQEDNSKPKPWEFTEFKIDEYHVLHFSTVNETETSMVFLERFKWNKWVLVDSIQGLGKAENHYEVKLQVSIGCYSFRLRGGTCPSCWYSPGRKPPQQICSDNYVPATFRPQKVRDSIWFSGPTEYEIYDAYGNIMLKGMEKSIYTGELKRGVYYINYDAEMGKFRKM